MSFKKHSEIEEFFSNCTLWEFGTSFESEFLATDGVDTAGEGAKYDWCLWADHGEYLEPELQPTVPRSEMKFPDYSLPQTA